MIFVILIFLRKRSHHLRKIIIKDLMARETWLWAESSHDVKDVGLY